MRMRRSVRIAAVLAALAAAGCSREGRGLRRADTGLNVLVIGIDGATWTVIRPLIAQGALPNLRRLTDEGVSANLESIRPLLSPAIWTTLATGKLPARHGVQSFHHTRYDLKAARMWDVVNASGGTVGVFDWLGTWPPDRVRGFVVPDWMARDASTWPPDLQFINEWGRGGHGLDLQKAEAAGLSAQSRESYELFSRTYREMSERERTFRYRAMETPARADLFVRLYREQRPQLAAYMTPMVDHISHVYWKYYRPDDFPGVARQDVRRYGDYVPDAYRIADAVVGRMLAASGSNTAVVVVSDHGFKTHQTSSGREIQVEALLEDLGWEGVVYEKLGGRAFLHLPEGGLTREEAAAALRNVKIAGTGQVLFNVSTDPSSDAVMIESVGEVSRVKLEGDVIVGQRQIPLSRILSPQVNSGTHALHGILIMSGPPFRRGVVLPRAGVADVAPTIMAVLGYPVASDLDGRVLRESIRPEFLERFPVRRVRTYGPPPALPDAGAKNRGLSEEDKERLRSLGYL